MKLTLPALGRLKAMPEHVGAIKLGRNGEAAVVQLGRYVLGVVSRILEYAGIRIVRVADH